MHPVATRLTRIAAAAIPLVCRAALADAPDPATAETLFRQGRASVDAGDYARACIAFSESERLDPAPGTLLNLADCEEHIGRLASAWAHFLRVESVLPATDERREIAHARAAVLAPRVPWMTFTLAPDMPRDARVFRDDIEVNGARGTTPMPVDPGPHSVLVVAPWHESRSVTVVAVEGETVRVVASPGPVVAHEIVRSARSHTAAWIVGAAGIASLGVGTYFGARAIAERSVSDASCSGSACSNATAVSAYESARSDARVSDVALGIGIAALAVGGFLLLTSGGDSAPRTALHVTGAGIGGAW